MKLNVKVDDQTFEVEVGELTARPIQVLVDGETFEVWPEEQAAVQAAAPVTAKPSTARPAAVKPAQAPTGSATPTKAVVAPIPGVIISISVKPGDSVTVGQELCVLEAMKMKNLIRANRAGKIASVQCAAGDQVRHGQVLMEFTD